MSYTINSAKDSQGNEQLYMELFNRLSPQIQQYKQQHGGDLEGAFGAVTGTPWPSGRSVKISHGQPEMTKDRTVKSVLGKYVLAPAVVGATAAFAPGALPAVAHGLYGAAMAGGGGALATRAGVGAVTGMMNGGGWKGALAGAGLGAVTGGAGGAGAHTATSTMTNMLTKAGAGAVQGAARDGWRGAASGAAGGVTSAIPGGAGRMLNMTGQSNVGGDIMQRLLDKPQQFPQQPGQSPFPSQPGLPTYPTTNGRPQGW